MILDVRVCGIATRTKASPAYVSFERCRSSRYALLYFHVDRRVRVFKRLMMVAIDLLEKMLDLDPEKRISSTDALKHEYVSAYQDSEDEPVFEKQLDWSLLDSELSADEWKTNMYVSRFTLESLDFELTI